MPFLRTGSWHHRWMDGSSPTPPKTATEAVALLRRVAEEREAWADMTPELHGEQSVDFARQEAMWFRTSADLIERGEYRGFGYAPE
jgi:hypothetical protein